MILMWTRVMRIKAKENVQIPDDTDVEETDLDETEMEEPDGNDMNESDSGKKDQDEDEDENEDHDIKRVPWNELDNSQKS